MFREIRAYDEAFLLIADQACDTRYENADIIGANVSVGSASTHVLRNDGL
jgi:hypothetical protein